jgi:hypothetical protein
LDSPEQKVLDKWLGTWRTTYTIPQTAWNPEERTLSADLVTSRVVGGRFTQEKSEHSDGSSGSLIATYDGRQRTYRSWWFSSQGYTSESTGTWDAKTSTMTWTSKQDGNESTTTFRFVDEDHAEWDLVIKAPGGQTVFLINGKSLRVKAPK